MKRNRASSLTVFPNSPQTDTCTHTFSTTSNSFSLQNGDSLDWSATSVDGTELTSSGSEAISSLPDDIDIKLSETPRKNTVIVFTLNGDATLMDGIVVTVVSGQTSYGTAVRISTTN